MCCEKHVIIWKISLFSRLLFLINVGNCANDGHPFPKALLDNQVSIDIIDIQCESNARYVLMVLGSLHVGWGVHACSGARNVCMVLGSLHVGWVVHANKTVRCDALTCLPVWECY